MPKRHLSVLAALVAALAPFTGCAGPAAARDDLLAFLEATAPAVDWIQVILVLAGAVLLAAGWQLHRYVIALPGFAISASLGALLAGYANRPCPRRGGLLGGAGPGAQPLSAGLSVGRSAGSFWSALASFAPGSRTWAILIAAFVGGRSSWGSCACGCGALLGPRRGDGGHGPGLDLGWVLILLPGHTRPGSAWPSSSARTPFAPLPICGGRGPSEKSEQAQEGPFGKRTSARRPAERSRIDASAYQSATSSMLREPNHTIGATGGGRVISARRPRRTADTCRSRPPRKRRTSDSVIIPMVNARESPAKGDSASRRSRTGRCAP